MSASPPAELKQGSETLLDSFDPIPYETWRAAVQQELKEVPFDKKLINKTYEGIDLRPLYVEKDIEGLESPAVPPGFAPYVRGSTAAGLAGKPWEVSQEISFPSALEFNTAARNMLERGLTALNVVLDHATRNGKDPDWAQAGEVGAGGLSIVTLEDLQRAFDGIDLRKVSLLIRSGSSALPFAALLAAMVRKRGSFTHNLRGCIEMDPIGVLSHEGTLPHSLKGAYREMAELTRWAYTHAPQFQTICIHARAWHESGGTAVQELAFASATAIEYFRAMHEHDLPVDRVAPRMRLAITVGSNFFMEIAKLRAARVLWSQIVNTLGGEESSRGVVLHVRTSSYNKTKFDPWVNMLRATTESLSAVLGGCDSLQVGAFDEALGLPDDFSRRIARNTQIILQKECDLTHVADPAGGSWYIEKLTDELARRAWSLVQEVEKRGGMAEALRAGFVQGEIARAAEQKQKDVTTRRRVLLGTTHYANCGERRIDKPTFDSAAFERRRRQQILSYRTQADELRSGAVMARLSKIVGAGPGQLMDACVEAVVEGATLGEVTRSIRIQDGLEMSITPVNILRAAEPFEALREKIEARVTAGQRRPSILLVPMGPLAQYKARADFAKGFVETAGFIADYPKGFKSPEEAAAAAAESDAVAAVLCSTDETYPALVGPLVSAIRARRPAWPILLAGYPADQVEAHRRSGIDDFIHLKADAVEVLKRLMEKVKIA